jgi:hypothetical protein
LLIQAGLIRDPPQLITVLEPLFLQRVDISDPVVDVARRCGKRKNRSAAQDGATSQKPAWTFH